MFIKVLNYDLFLTKYVLWFEKKVMKIQTQKRKGNNSENLQQKRLYYEVKKNQNL